jgi:hypothetical protein
MIILDKPFVSKFLQETIRTHHIPVFRTKEAESLPLDPAIPFLSEEAFVQQFHATDSPILYASSENSISWIQQHLGDTGLPAHIQLFKNKFAFRQLMAHRYPNFQFIKVRYEDLKTFDLGQSPMSFPFIIKPVVGFFSIGVYHISNQAEWEETIEKMEQDLANNADVFPQEVLNNSEFILEEYIVGEEFAVDVYFDKESNPVILNIYHHYFASEADTGDRMYVTSKEIIEKYRKKFADVLTDIGHSAEIKHFATHIELRVSPNGENIGIIEVNPMRFAGFCVGDLVYYAYGVNSYTCFLDQCAPDWDSLLEGKDGKIYGFVLGDFPHDLTRDEVASIDYDKFLQKFKRPLNLRKIDFRSYPIFAILFVEFDAAHPEEMQAVLQDDFRDCIVLKKDQ